MKILSSIRSTKGRVLIATAVAITMGVGIGLPRIASAASGITIGDVTTAEGTGASPTVFQFTVTLSPAETQSVTVNWATEDVSAKAGAPNNDYTAGNGTVSFAPGETTKTINVNVTADAFAEPDELFRVRLSSPSNATITDGVADGNVNNDDGAVPVVQVEQITAVSEGNQPSTQTQAISIGLTTGVATQPISVSYTTTDDTATVAGNDYVAASGTATIQTGQPSVTVNVTVIGDNLHEGESEAYKFTISNPNNAALGTATRDAVITDNDPKPEVRVDNITTGEGNAGTSTVAVTFRLAVPANGNPGPSGSQITVAYATSDGPGANGATAGSDYVAKSGNVVFPAGTTSVTENFTVNGDVLDEKNEIFRVNISQVTPNTAATIAATSYGEVTIADDETSPVASVADISVTEGNAGITAATFTITLSAASGSDVNMNVATAGPAPCTPQPTCTPPPAATGSGAGADYDDVSPAQPFTIPAGQTSKTFAVTVFGDTADEPNEQFRLLLTQTAGGQEVDGVIADDTATATITDDDDGPVVSLIGDQTINEPNAGSTNMTFTFQIVSGSSNSNVDVNFATVNGSAVSGEDYTATSGTAGSNGAQGTAVRFAPGETTKTVTVPITGDTTPEPDETFTLNITAVRNGTAGDAQSTGLIVNNDGSPPTVTVTKTANATEGGGGATFQFSVTGMGASQTVSVDWATQAGTATSPADFAAATGTVTFTTPIVVLQQPAPQTVTVNAVNDNIDEVDETFSLVIVTGRNTSTAGSPAEATIVDNDPKPSLAIADKAVAEGNANSTQNIVVTLTGASADPVTVDWAAGAQADPAKSPADYTAPGGTLTFAPGETTKNIPVQIVGDLLDEPDETFTVALLNASSNATIGDAAAIVTITDDDATPTVSVNSVSAPEGGNLTFTISQSAASGRDVTVSVATANGTAQAPGDYTAVPATTVTIPAGETNVSQTVATADDTTDEPNETLTLNLSSPTNATVAPNGGSGTGTINDNDDPPVISVNSGPIGEAAGNATFTVTLSNKSSSQVTVSISSQNGTATAPADYTALAPTTLTFAPGEDTKTVNVPINNDSLDETDETFTVTLANPTNATLSPSNTVGTATIVDNDSSPTLSIADNSGTEGSPITFTVTMSAASGRDVTFTRATADGTAVAPADYNAQSPSTITIPAGQTQINVGTLTAQDTLDEPNETFTMNISNPDGATIADGSATGTITDNDDAPSAQINSASSAEEGEPVTFTVTLSGASGQDVSVKVNTANGTAGSGDYTALSDSTVTVPAGQTSKTFAVATTEDSDAESNETFTATISAPTNATLGTTKTGTGTIVDDDETGGTTTTTTSTTTTSTTSTTLVPGSALPKITTGPGPGGGPHIKSFNPNGTAIGGGFMDGSESGGKRVARGDVNGDGIDEIITGSGPNTPAIVSVYTPSGTLIASSFAYANGSFFGGIFVAAGDVDGDGRDEVITSPGPGGGPHIRTWRVTGSTITGNDGFMAYGLNFTGGVTVGVGDFNGDDKEDIVTGPGAGGGPHVRAFNANGSELFGLMAYTGPTGQPNWTGGINVAAGDLDGDGKAEIGVAPWQGGGPHVKLFNHDGSLRNSGAFVGSPSFNGGITIAMADLTNDDKAEILVGAMTQTTTVRIYKADLTPFGDTFTAYPGFGGGVFVAIGKQ